MLQVLTIILTLINSPVPPTINKFTVGEHLRLGQRVSMLCSVTDGDLPLTLKWYRHDQFFMPECENSAGGISIMEIGSYESLLCIDNLRPKNNNWAQPPF